jgi:hypothetical protein
MNDGKSGMDSRERGGQGMKAHRPKKGKPGASIISTSLRFLRITIDIFPYWCILLVSYGGTV